MEHHAQYINRGELAGRGGSLLGHRSAGGEQLHCASLVFSWVLYLFFYYIPFHYNYYINISSSIFCFTLVIKLFLSQPTSFTFFLLPTPLGGGRDKQLCGA